ncbi:hypothetical protein EsHS_00006973 [Epichloe bromicola]
MILSQFIGLLAIGLAPLAVSADPFPITGVPVKNGTAVPARKNINDLYSQGGPQWDLYLRALRSLQDTDASDPRSYFQLAGIHGLPYVEWNGGGLPWDGELKTEAKLNGELKTETTAPWKGYSPHGYMEAAEQLRSPYWDWSANSTVPPCTIPMEAVVNVPDGSNLTKMTIDNPLHEFRYPEEARDYQFGEFPNLLTTKRCPRPWAYPESANRRLAQWTLKQDTYDIFMYSDTFEQFANTHENATSLEQMHVAISREAGCAGQFSNEDLTAMLHHTHVDRLWAYWQFMNEDHATFTNHYLGQSRFSTPPNTWITPDSPLEPFYDHLLAYWTPKKISSIRGLGYTYEPLHYWNTSEGQLAAVTSVFTSTTARLELERAQVERPCAVGVFINGTAAGQVVVQLPETGILRDIVAVDQKMQAAFAATSPSNGIVSAVEPLIEIDLMKPNGAIIPLRKAPSLKLTFEEVSVTPVKSDTEFPTPGDRKTHAVGLRDRHVDGHPRRFL